MTDQVKAEPLSSSFRDPDGFIYRRDGVLYRQVNQSYAQNYDILTGSGLFDRLVKSGLLIPHLETNIPALNPEIVYKTLLPEAVSFISYPYEWCFSQLKKAALVVLQIQQVALEFGMSLKDSSAYNIQFHRGSPIWIDTLSFERYQEGKPWNAYRQFCQHFLAPLALMAYRDVRLNTLLRSYIDGVPLDLASKLLPFKSRLNSGITFHIHLHAASQAKYAGKSVSPRSGKMNKTAFLGLLDNLRSTIERFSWSPSKTEWANYYEASNYSDESLLHKKTIVEDYLGIIKPSRVWDLGANTGLYSRMASVRGIDTIAFDIDPGTVEINYLEMLKSKEQHLLPLVMDLTNPSPAIGWRSQERMSFQERGPVDTIFALALVHHLAIGNNVPLADLAGFFASLCRWLVVEFVPKSDSQVQRMLTSRVDIFPDYSVEGFEREFCRKFTILKTNRIDQSERILYLMEAIPGL